MIIAEWDEKGRVEEKKKKMEEAMGGGECLRVELLKNSALEGQFGGEVDLLTPPRHLLLLDSFILGRSRFLKERIETKWQGR